MNTLADKFLSGFLDVHRDTLTQTVAALGEVDALAFTAHTEDAFKVFSAVQTAYDAPAFTTSLVAAFLPSLGKEMYGMQFDLLCGRYPEGVRSLRVLGEKLIRAFCVDVYASHFPGADDYPGATVDEKLNWYADRERTMSGKKLTEIAVQFFIDGTPSELREHFGGLWNRIHAMAHPSAEQIGSDFGESARLVFNNLDEALARRLIGDAAEVFSLIWGMVMVLFPRIVTDLASQPHLFRCAPQARLLLSR